MPRSSAAKKPETAPAPQPVRLFAVPDSSHISDLGYSVGTHQLFVRFKSSQGFVYVYESVPEEVWTDLASTDSVGSYFDRVIKKSPDFTFRKVPYGG